MSWSVKLKPLLVGVLAGVVLVTGPSLMILRGVAVLSRQEVVLWSVEFLTCVVLSMVPYKCKGMLSTILFAYGFLFLYNALAILCFKVNLGVIAWHPIRNVGLMLVMIVAVAAATVLYAPFLKSHKDSKIGLFPLPQVFPALQMGIASLLTGIALIYYVWPPLLAIPGALVLVSVCYPRN